MGFFSSKREEEWTGTLADKLLNPKTEQDHAARGIVHALNHGSREETDTAIGRLFGGKDK